MMLFVFLWGFNLMLMTPCQSDLDGCEYNCRIWQTVQTKPVELEMLMPWGLTFPFFFFFRGVL